MMMKLVMIDKWTPMEGIMEEEKSKKLERTGIKRIERVENSHQTTSAMKRALSLILPAKIKVIQKLENHN